MECTNEQVVTLELKDYKKKKVQSLYYCFMTQTKVKYMVCILRGILSNTYVWTENYNYMTK